MCFWLGLVMSKGKVNMKNLILIYVLILLIPMATLAQSTTFSFQGRLNDGATAATGNVELEVRLYDSFTGGTQIGSTVNLPSVPLINGVFSTELDFGGTAFDGSPRFLEIGVRPAGSANPFTVLAPRQHLNAVTYAAQSGNAAQLGGIDANQYVSTATVGSSFIRNGTTTQTGNFNIDGNGVVGGNLGVGTTNPQAKLDVNGTAQITTGGSGGQVIFASPNGESGMLIRGTSRADIRFDGSTLKLLAGVNTGAPISTNGIAITTSGNVGVGTTTPTSKFVVNSGGSGGEISLGNPNGESGMSIVAGNRADVRFDGAVLKMVVGPAGSPPPPTRGINIDQFGRVGIGTTVLGARLDVDGQGSTALAITNGAIRVTGAGINTNTAAFILVKTAANTCGGAGGVQTAIDNTFTDGDPNAILTVTARAVSTRFAIAYVPLASTPPACPQLANKWSLLAFDGVPVGSQFNVLVIKP